LMPWSRRCTRVPTPTGSCTTATGVYSTCQFNNERLLEPIGHVPPAEFEELHYRKQEALALVAGLK